MIRDDLTGIAVADLQNRLIKGLACAALNSALGSLLVFEASPPTLQVMAELLAQMIAVVTGGQLVWANQSKMPGGLRMMMPPINLGAVETEENLWGSLVLGKDGLSSSIMWKSGMLSGGRHPEIRIVVIPDLARLSLAARRACVMLMGAEVAHLERHGQCDRWHPQLYWLAGCNPEKIGEISPHLLDRFALRLGSGESQYSFQREAQLQVWLREDEPTGEEPGKSEPSFKGRKLEAPPLSTELKTKLQQAQLINPEMLSEARKRVLDYFDPTDGMSIRRDLALLRLARVHAQLEGFSSVTRRMLERAADMIGVYPKQHRPKSGRFSSVPFEGKTTQGEAPSDTSKETPTDAPSSELTPESDRPKVLSSNETQTFSSSPLPLGDTRVNPYLEEEAQVQREAASLRLPPRRFRSVSSGEGVIIGMESATMPQDLALVGTLLEAVKYQKIRWQALLSRDDLPEWLQQIRVQGNQQECRPLILMGGDLRQYRRAVVPEQRLTLVVDYTCLGDCLWQGALLPYLQWAYVERASVCLVQVGAIDARDELRAEKREANKILVPSIRDRLEVGRGRATPLAHGLDLAYESLRHGLQHGRSQIQKALLVVISDGRGNVPLEASRIGTVSPPVGRKGIEDALEVAQQIANLKGLEAVVLNPQPKHYSDLPVQLAQALGAKIAKIPTLKPWEVDQGE